MSLLQTAREASGDLHGRIERTRLAGDLVAGRVSREDYSRLLVGLIHIHEAVEGRLHRPTLAALEHPNLRRLHIAQADHESLGGENEAAPEAIAPWEEALDLMNNDWAWVGALYVLEGSRMGSRMLLKPIAAALGVEVAPGNGVDYHLSALGNAGQSWSIFKTFLESANPYAASRSAFADGVRQTFQMMHDMYVEIAECATVGR
jgi:heme oxygenase